MPASDVKAEGYILGIDIGTQSLKAVITDRDLKIISTASETYDVLYPEPGWAEQDPLAWENVLPGVIAAALQKKNLSPKAIAAIGIAGQLDGCIAVGNDGVPLSNALIWMDRRAIAQTDRAIERTGATLIREKTGILPDAGHMGAKIAWLKEHGGPSGSGLTAVRCFHQPVSYLVSRLTGRHVFDPGLASTTMLYSLKERAFDPELLAAFGIHREELPEVADSAEIAGHLNAKGAELTGLPEGIPVAVGTGDDFSSPLGAGMVSPGKMICILGTAEVVGALDYEPKIDAKDLVETHPYVGGTSTAHTHSNTATFFIENPGWLSGGALTWFQDTFGYGERLQRAEDLDALAALAPAGSEGLLFIPALSGAMAPEWNAKARGCFYGLTPSHGLSHMARAVLEGCAFAMRDVQKRLQEMQVPIESILLTGGGAKSTLWAQIRADVSELPVYIAENKDTSTMGAAVLAATACGAQPSVEVAARLVNHTASQIQPLVANFEAYRKAYSRYQKLFQSLKPFFEAQ